MPLIRPNQKPFAKLTNTCDLLPLLIFKNSKILLTCLLNQFQMLRNKRVIEKLLSFKSLLYLNLLNNKQFASIICHNNPAFIQPNMISENLIFSRKILELFAIKRKRILLHTKNLKKTLARNANFMIILWVDWNPCNFKRRVTKENLG